ncbi:hypothetical protein ACROYT_G037817 [Oculina patagonica]
MQTGQWHKLENKRHLLVRNELYVIGKLVLRGTQNIVPSSLRERVLQLVHERHPGIASTKRRLRTKVWLPGCDKDAEMFCKTCNPCQMFISENLYRVTPLWPPAIGEAERQNRSLLKRFKIAQIEKRNWKEEIASFLSMYRTTPHSTTGASPAKLLICRKLRTRIPRIEEFPVDYQKVHDRDSETKEKGKLYADEKGRARESDEKQGDMVLLKQERKTKLNDIGKEPYLVLDKTGNSVAVESADGVR